MVSEEQTSDEVREEATAGEPAEGEETLTRMRELILQAHPDVVPELIAGASFDELLASVEPARAAYTRIAEQARSTSPSPVPAGQPGRRPAVNVEDLSPAAKIAEGLRRRDAVS